MNADNPKKIPTFPRNRNRVCGKNKNGNERERKGRKILQLKRRIEMIPNAE